MKLAADSVLCEVRKKQTDVKRMQDILRSLEKLRKLRKEAASRKGKNPSKFLIITCRGYPNTVLGGIPAHTKYRCVIFFII